MEDKLQLFYNSLTANPNIKGLPGDYELFRTTLADPGKSELFYNSLKANRNIKGLPESYDEFVTGLALNSGGITPKEPEQEKPGFLEGLNKKFASSIYGAAEAITEAPQFGEAVKKFGMQTLANAYINRLVKKGKITAEQGEAEKKKIDIYLPTIDFVGVASAPYLAKQKSLGAKMADSKANKWLSETSDRLSKEGTRYDERVVDYLKKGQIGKALGAEVYSITESLAPTLLAALGGPVGAGALGVMTGAETYDEVKDREDMQEAAKVIDGLSTGVFEALFEYLGTAEMTKMLKNAYARGTKEQVEEALKGTVGGLLSKAYKRFGVWLAPVHEGLSEGLTTLGQNATAKFTGEDPERKLNDNFIESVLIGMGMGGVFAGTEKGLETLAKKFKGTPVDQGPAAIGELKVPYTQEQAAEIINNIGRDLKFGDTPLEEDPSPMISFAQTMIGQKVILKKEGGIKGDDFFIAFDLETNEPVLVKAKDIKERKDVPYQEWFNNELQNYNIVKSQADNMAAQMEAPVQPGQEITLKDKNFYVSEVTPEGIVLNEIDEEGNISGASLQITPDQYNTVFGTGEGIQETENLPENELPSAMGEGIQAAPEAPGARTLTVGKTNYSVVPDETGILTIDQVFTDEAVAKNAVKALEKGYPKASFSLQKTEFEDFLTPDEYRITVQPKKAKAEPAKPEGKAEKPAEPEKVEPVKVVGKNEKGEEIRVGDEIGYQWRDGFITKPGKVIGVEHDPGSNVTWVKTDGPEGENKLNISVAQVVKPEEPAEVIDEKKEEAPSTPDETAPEEVKQKAGEVEKPAGRFAPVEKVLDMTGQNMVNEWEEHASPIDQKVTEDDKKIAELTKQKRATRKRDEKAKIDQQIQDIRRETAQLYNDLENEYFERNESIKQWGIAEAKKKGIEIDPNDENDDAFFGDLMTDIFERPGREHTWEMKFKDVFDENFNYWVNNKMFTQLKEKEAAADLTKANKEVDTHPTEAQKKAGNYKKGHLSVQGFDISIENPAASVRSGTDKSGKKWSVKLNNSYGYFRRTKGKDGDQIDVFLGDNLNAPDVYVVDQVDPATGLFDEHKVMMGFNSAQDARDNYLANYEPSWKGIGAISKMSVDQFKEWLGNGTRTRKPVDNNVPVQKAEEPSKPAGKIAPAEVEFDERQIRENAEADERGKIWGFEKMPVDEYGWAETLLTPREHVTLIEPKKGHPVMNELIAAKGPNGKWASSYNIQISDRGSGSYPGIWDEPFNTKAEAFSDAAAEIKEWAESQLKRADVSKTQIRELNNLISAADKYIIKPKSLKKAEFAGEILEKNPKAEKPSKPIKEVTLRPKRKFTWGPNSRTGKVMAKTPNSFREAVLQFFVGGGRIKTQDFLDHTGYKRGSREFKQYIWAFKNDGVRLDVFHEAIENRFGIEDKGYMDMINEVIDILRTYPGRGQMITALEELQNVDKVPDHMPPPEEDPALEYDDLQGADEEVNKIVDDIMELPEVKEIVKQYSSDGILDVDKLLAGIEANPGEFTIFPFALKKSELLKLKERLQDEQRRRTQESQARTDQYNQDQGQGTGENTPRSAQGNTVRAGREETTEPAGRPEVTLENPQKPKSEFVGEILEQGVSKPTSKEYRYKMLARPFDIGTFPKPGFIKSENDPEGGYQILTYDRKLTPEEQRKWEFLPLTEIAEIKGKEFVDKDGYFSRIVLNWFGGDKYAKVSMYDTDGNLADEIPGMKASEILQNVNEGYWTEKTKEGGTKDDQKDKTGLPGEKREGKEPEQAKPVEETGTKETPASGVFQAQKEQVNILKDLVSAEVTAEATQKRIDELGRIQNPTKNQLQELKYQKLALDPLQTRIEKLKSQVDNTIVPEVKVTEIKQLILETEAANAIIGDRIIGLQNKRNAKEKELQKRNEAFGDRKLEEEKKAGMQTMFAGDIFAPDAGNLKAALKPFNDAIQKSKEELLRNDQLLDEQIDLVLKGTQQKIKYGGPKELEPKESPVASRPTTPIEDQMPLEQDDKPTAIEPENKESLPKLEDFGEKIGGARKDLGITRKVRDTDSLPAWRRKYSYANADGTMIIGQAVDTSKPFIVQWAKEIDSWVGKRTRYSPVTTIDTRETKIFNSEDEAEAYIPIYEVWKQNFRVHKSGDNYVITKKSSTGKAVEYATFPTEEDANVYMYSTEGATSLLNHKREDFSIPALDKVERSGKDWRKGKDISPEEFMNAFGFRGGEFGNWVKPEERRVMLNAAYDSFMDLAALLNIPPKALSFGGELSIAFGARGTKGAAAHFEPDRAVINLTRMNGAGSLAHEWAHALDNYFGLQGAKKDYSRNEKGEVKAGRVMRTEAGLLSIQGMRQQLSTIFDAIVDATQQKSVTRVMGIDEKQKSFDKIKKNVQQDADSLIKKFENGVRRYQYNRKTKQREEVTVKATPKQIKKAKEIVNIIIDGKGTKPVWQRIPGSKGMGKYSYISPETLALEELHKAVFGRTGLDRDGNGFYNLGYFSDKMYRAKEILDKALAGESETLNVPTDFLKTSKTFDASRAMPYWSTKVEMFARAFEYFVETKLLDQNIRADYLQYDKAPVYEAIYGKNPYPSGEERSNLNNLFGKFFETIQTKEEDGKVAMFRISEDLYFSPVERALGAIKQDKATVQQWKAMLLKNGAKETELAWMGWDDFASIFEGTSDMNKDHIQTWINQNKVEIKEVGYGGEAKDDKYDQLLKDIDKAQEPILRFNALYGDYPYYNITTDKWVYKDEQGNIKDVPEKYMPDVLKWGEAKRALDDYIDDNTNIYGDFEVAGATKYSQYTLPGGEDYKELLLTMPGKPNLKPIDYEVRKIDLGDGEYSYRVYDNRGIIRGRDFETPEAAEDFKNGLEKSFVSEIVDTRDLYQSGHWDQPNILAHVRFNTRRSPDGKNILFIEEIHDWAQTGKKKGFNGIFDEQRFENWYKDHRHSTDPSWEEYQKLSEVEKKEYRDAFLDELNNMGYVPDMPYKKTDQWAGLALRRMVRYAIDNGFDAIAWTPGEIQNERYDLSKQVDELWIQKSPKNPGKLSITGYKGDESIISEYIDPDKLADYVGKEIADKYNSQSEEEKFTPGSWEEFRNFQEELLQSHSSTSIHELERYLRHQMSMNLSEKKDAEKYFRLEVEAKKEQKAENSNGLKVFKGADLKVGGSGMTGFYDNILPSIANKLGKKFGSQVEKVVVSERIDRGLFFDGTDITDADGNVVKANTSEDEYKKLVNADKDNSISVHSLPITEAMFDSYRQGIPLFKKSQRLTGESLLFDVVSGSTRENWENEVRDKVRILADSLNTKIEVINNRTQLPERIQRQALRQGITSRKHMAGVYDPQTDTVYVLLDDIRATGTIRGIEEVTKTVLHEVVAHQGLPALLGEEEYNKFLDDLFWNIPQIDRSFLMEQYNTSNPRTIAEEYLGMMAEQNINPTLFQKVLAKIRQLLRKLFKVNYTENDIHDMLRRSRENLQKPRASDYTSAQEYLEATDSYEKARFRIAQAYKKNIVDQAAEVYKEKEAKRSIEETKQGIREYIQDLNLPIRKFEEEVLKRGGKQGNDSKPYRDTSLSFGRHEKLYNDFFDQKMKPVLSAVANIKKTGIPGENVLPYIICKHAVERNRVFREKELAEFIENNPEAGPEEINDFEMSIRNKDYSGVMPFDREGKYTSPDDLAKDIVKEFEAQVINKKLIDDLWEKLRESNTEILNTWEAGQQISADQKKEYLDKFKYFVPLRGWREGAAKELKYTRGQGFSNSLRHAEGRKSLADNPLAYILNVEFQAIAEQVTNEVNNSMLNLIIRNLGNNEIHELATLKKLYYLKVNLPDGSYEWEPTLTRPSAEQFARDEARTKIFREHERLRAPSQAREHEVIVKKPGGDMVMIFKGKNLPVAQALNKQNYMYRPLLAMFGDDTRKGFHGGLATIASLNNMLKAAYTSWNVVFPFTNFMRDFQEASITQAIKQGTGLRVIRNYKHTFPAIIRYIAGKQNLSNSIDQKLDEFYKTGGATGYTHLKTPEEIEKDINKEIKRMVRAGTLRGDMVNTAHKLLTGIEYWNRIFEDATRFSVYLASLAAGNTKEDAASDAKEASVNFNRKGKGSKAWDAWFAFFNVAIQSMQKNFSLAKNYTGKFSAVALSFVTVGFLEAMMNAFFDDDDETSYYNINPYMRQNYLVIPNIPALLRGESKGDKYLSIPLPQFWRGFKSMGAIGFDIAAKRMNVKEGVMNALGNFGSALLPVDIGGFWKSGEFSFAPIMPTVIKPITEVFENRNYMGYAIKNEPFTREQEKKLANAGLGKKNVSPAAKFITDMLFRWGGGDSKYKYYYDSYKEKQRKVPGILDINPSTLEHLFKGYTGGTGAVFSDIVTTISQGLDTEQDIDYRNAPFVNKFIRKIPEAKWNVISEYYDLRDDSKITSDLSTNYFKEGQYEKALEIMGDEYLMKYVETFKHYESALDDAKKDTDFDEVEGNYRGIELMRQCISDIKDLKEQFGRK